MNSAIPTALTSHDPADADNETIVENDSPAVHLD